MPINEICILKNIPNYLKMIKSVRVKCCGLCFFYIKNIFLVFCCFVSFFTLFKMCLVCLLRFLKCFILRKHTCEYLIIQIMIKNSYFSQLDIYEKHPYSKSTTQLL